ncbi:MerR family transcriptional regulator [Anoxynatronum buryatiense]|uniref:MerR HTH family regulatory protein n=1 Tax=Anoxynatronum buryatiense TaxID=489973 RepID=A0AA45WXS3_9CLOT|nr:MerR family transcriptional regulator [Anoxynatronum buryatiense]SMP65892.1 MerR HTH family regulatory protein [Anoxynatronum buryatiense]
MYRTSDIARKTGIHPNTVRFYERLGLISPVARSTNGYRVFDDRHLVQVKVLRCIYLDEWPGEAIRKASLKIVEALKVWDLETARRHAQSYQATIAAEAEKALLAIEILSQWAANSELISETDWVPNGALTSPSTFTSRRTTGETLLESFYPLKMLNSEELPASKDIPNPSDVLNRREAAALIGVTPEALRNWERNDLIQVPRQGRHQTRFYRPREIQRLQVIYLLRQARFSMSAIHRCFTLLDAGHPEEALNALKHPHAEALWTGDRWLAVLEMFAAKADEIDDLLRSIGC